VLLNAAGRPVTVDQLERKTRIKGKPLGALLSSLSRTRFKNQSLIAPAGKSQTSTGLRWFLNKNILNLKTTKTQVNQLLKTYV